MLYDPSSFRSGMSCQGDSDESPSLKASRKDSVFCSPLTSVVMEEAAVEDREVVEDDDECSWDAQIQDRDDDDAAVVQAVVGTDDTRTEARATRLNFMMVGAKGEGGKQQRDGAGSEEQGKKGDLRKARPLATDCTVDSRRHIRN
jgi:hypothetical protein